MKILFGTLLSILLISQSIAQQQFNRQITNKFKLKNASSETICNKDGIVSRYEREPCFIADITASRADSLINVAFDDTTLYRFSYNETGSLNSYYCYEKINGNWEKRTRIFYTYAPNGKKSMKLSEDWSNNMWVNSSRITYTYYSSGMINTILIEAGTKTGWENDAFVTYQYNSDKLMTNYIYQFWDGSLWVNDTQISREYNSKGEIIVEAYDYWIDNAWALVMKDTYTYTDWGAVKEHISLNNYSLEGAEIYKYVYLYNSGKLVINETAEKMIDSVWKPYTRTAHSYEMNNLIHKQYCEKWDDSVWVNDWYEIDSLSADNKIVYTGKGSWVGGKWVLQERTTNTYNSKGNYLSIITEQYLNNSWGYFFKGYYSYDPTGELLTTFKCNYWVDGNPVGYARLLELNIDSNSLTDFEIASVDIKIWYKKVTVPVELTSFSGSMNNKIVTLKWNTATETNNRGFEVEKKNGTEAWQKIGYLTGAGTTSKQTSYLFEDKNISEGKVFYRLKQVDFDGTFTYSQQIEINSSVVKDYSLEQNYPNPFNPSTVINYAIPSASKVKINIYNTAGQLVKELVNGVKETGAYNVKFDASNLSSGVYFYTIDARQIDGKNSFRNSKKMILIK